MSLEKTNRKSKTQSTLWEKEKNKMILANCKSNCHLKKKRKLISGKRVTQKRTEDRSGKTSHGKLQYVAAGK